MQKPKNLIFKPKWVAAHNQVKYALFKSTYRLSSAANARTGFAHVSDIKKSARLPYGNTVVNKGHKYYDHVTGGLPILGSSTACFAVLPNEIKCVVPYGYNRIIYSLYEKIEVYITEEKTFTLKEVEQYLTLAKKNKCLPSYVNIHRMLQSSSIILDLDTPKQLLFIYLTIFRTILHDPQVVNAVVYLVTELKLDFFKALCLAHSHICTNSNHSFFPAEVFKYPAPAEITLDSFLPDIIPVALKKIIAGDTTKQSGFGVDFQILKLAGVSRNLESIKKASKKTTLRQHLKPSILKQLSEAAHAS